MKKILWIFLLSLVACQNTKVDSKSNEAKESEELNNKKPLVSVYEVKTTSFKDYFHTQGSVVSKEIVYVKPEINGSIKTIHVEEGDYIMKGDSIVTISIDLLSAQIAELNEQISFAEYLFKKQQSMFEEGVSTEMQLKEMESNLKRSIKAKNTLLTQVEKGRVIAPFNGYVDEISVKLGESISPMTNICQLVNTDQLFVVADISENLLSEVAKGDPLKVFFPSINLELENLSLNRIGKVINPINRTLKIEAKLPKVDILIPNLMAELSINHYSKDSAICLPSRVILKNSNGETYIKILDQNKRVVIKPISLGRRDRAKVEITSPIEIGTLVVDDGKSTIIEGQQVEIYK